MTARPGLVTAADLALLESLARERSVVAASRRVGISRDRAVYRLSRLRRAFGGPVVVGARGGRRFGGSWLTPLGDRIVREGFDSVELLRARPLARPSRPNLLTGVFRRDPAAAVVVAPGLALRVPFAAEDAEPVAVRLDPESILVARGRFPSSARNVLPAVVEAVRPGPGAHGRTVVARVGPLRLRASVTDETVAELRLTPRARVFLYVKATALRRAGPPATPTRGSPRRRARTPPPPRAGSASR